jgi:hypothetical protein
VSAPTLDLDRTTGQFRTARINGWSVPEKLRAQAMQILASRGFPASDASVSDGVLELALQIASLPTTTLAVAQSINLTSESP